MLLSACAVANNWADPSAVNSGIIEACSAFYAAKPEFTLDSGRELDPVASMPPPLRGEVTEEPTYGTCLTRLTDHSADFSEEDRAFYGENMPVFTRNDYSRRQAFNADGSLVLIYDSTGHWHVYDAHTTERVKRLAGLAADAEPHWDPVDPDSLVYLPPWGLGATVHELTVSTNASRVIGDLKGRLDAIWPGADQADTGAEGSPSRDGRYWCFKVRANDESTFRSVGLIAWDRETDQIIGTYDLDGEDPDAVSMSPSGEYCVMQVADGEGQTRRTVVFSQDLTTQYTIQEHIEHADLAVGANGHDVYVSIDYQSNGGWIFMYDLVTQERTNLLRTYLEGTATAVHFSGKAYGAPGWVLVSTYAASDTERQWLHGKVFALRLDATAEVRNLAFHRSIVAGGGGYFAEPHASVNQEFSRVIFNSNWDDPSDHDVDAYMVILPDGWLAQSDERAGQLALPVLP